MCVCVCVRERERVSVCVWVGVYVAVGGCPGASECACACARVAILIHHATRLRYIFLSFLASLYLPNFSTLSRNRYDFRNKKVIEHKMCVLVFSTTFI